MVFGEGLWDPCTWDVVQFSERVKIHEPRRKNLATSRLHGSRNPARKTIQ